MCKQGERKKNYMQRKERGRAHLQKKKGVFDPFTWNLYETDPGPFRTGQVLVGMTKIDLDTGQYGKGEIRETPAQV